MSQSININITERQAAMIVRALTNYKKSVNTTLNSLDDSMTSLKDVGTYQQNLINDVLDKIEGKINTNAILLLPAVIFK